MGYLVMFGFFSFSAEKWIFVLFLFSFLKRHLRWADKGYNYVRNWTVTKFCDIFTGDFRFRFSAENGILYLSAFSFTAENEKCIFGLPLLPASFAVSAQEVQ